MFSILDKTMRVRKHVTGKTVNIHGDTIKKNFYYVIAREVWPRRWWRLDRVGKSLEYLWLNTLNTNDSGTSYSWTRRITGCTHFNTEEEAQAALKDMLENPNKYYETISFD